MRGSFARRVSVGTWGATRLAAADQRSAAADDPSSDALTALAVIDPAKYVTECVRDFPHAGTDRLLVTPACIDIRSAGHTWETVGVLI
jgi:hypothetical protein